MARSRNSRKRRDVLYISNQRLPLSNVYSHSTFLTQIEDRRSYHPENINRPIRSFNNANSRTSVWDIQPRAKNPPSRKNALRLLSSLHGSVPVKIGFEKPDQTLVCVRRNMRREVLFASRKTGKSGQRRPRWTELSNIKCRRHK